MATMVLGGAIFSLWCAIWWRLRGGAATALTGWDPGTGGMRAIAAVAIGTPMAAAGWLFLAMIPLFWISWSIAGWGAFQGQGHETTVEMKNPVAAFLERIGLAKIGIDLVGMAIEGVLTLTLPAILVGYLIHPWLGVIVAACGIGFAPLYFIPQHSKTLPNAGRFARAGSEWGEVLVGAWVGVVLAIALMEGRS